MRVFWTVIVLVILVTGCEDNRIYEQYIDFEEGYWLVDNKPEFEFVIDDTNVRYTLYGNVRNAVSYPWSRLFMTYYLQDSIGNQIHKSLISDYLFESKSGEPLGTSGLGDIYDHRLMLLKDYQFKDAGKYKIKFEQFMRTDTLQGVLAVGLRIEKSVKP
ncbi:gliding motility lipoprotein GldH [Ohtaekwangia koreensis]|uniref:Gliding motility-associated lipoprotein GldH n=1 Tax=Ohtaekwangia koreensis TaxID=688867 RepID=A0A1T5LM28_9BACT|nr:gliding motility lipoprotein GldH [Ohtaekwangia koreensis]SKC77103.1 gliding motility-associated lipoprotein GldH [Ohtaekwangia koreensis]